MKRVSEPIKIVLADDHELFRDGFRVMVNKQPDVALIGEADDGEALLKQVSLLQPDVVITDMKMPKLDGLQVMRRLQKEQPHIGVIALTNYDDEALIVDMLEAGAKGYLLKSAHKKELLEAIQTVHQGKDYYCYHTNRKLANRIATSAYVPHRRHKAVIFNEREKQIISLICEECTNKEMADRLFLSVRTIETHREHILQKMDVKNTAGIVIYAVKHALYKI